MTDLRTAAVQLAVIKEVIARAKQAELDLKGVFLDELEPGDAKQATLEDGVKLGRVSYVGGHSTPEVVDERALVKWVSRHRPDEIVKSVRPSYLASLKASAKEHGVPVTPDGEIVPGIECREGNPYITYRGAPGAGEHIAARWQELLGVALKALPGGSDA